MHTELDNVVAQSIASTGLHRPLSSTKTKKKRKKFCPCGYKTSRLFCATLNLCHTLSDVFRSPNFHKIIDSLDIIPKKWRMIFSAISIDSCCWVRPEPLEKKTIQWQRIYTLYLYQGIPVKRIAGTRSGMSLSYGVYVSGYGVLGCGLASLASVSDGFGMILWVNG